MNQPLVSVLLPVYNGEAYLKPAIESVLSQTFTNWELFVGDNASTDGTRGIIESYRDARIRIHRHDTNIGMVANWDFLLQNAHGNFACVLGADDLFYPTHLEKAVVKLREFPEAAFIHGAADFINVEGKLIRKHVPPAEAQGSRKDLLQLFLKQNGLVPTATVFPLDAVRRHHLHFDLRFELLLDYHLWAALLLCSKSFFYTSEITTAYRVHESSISVQSNRSFEWVMQGIELRLDLLQRFARQWQEAGFNPELEKPRVTKGLWALAFQQARRGCWPAAKRAWKTCRDYHGVGGILCDVPAHYLKQLQRR